MSALSTIVAGFRKGSPNIARAFDEVERRLTLLEKPAPPPVPAPTPTPTPAPAGVVELEGTLTADQFLAATAGTQPVTVRPKPGKTLTVTGAPSPRNGCTYEGIVFDGQGKVENIWATDLTDITYRRCTFKGYWVADYAAHCQALYIGGGCDRWLIDGCTLVDFGNTSAIFITWFGSTKRGGWWDTANYPRDIKIKGCTFGRPHDYPGQQDAYFSINFADVPSDAPIWIEPGQTSAAGLSARPEFVRPAS